jgi:hypothetical protein
MGNPEQLQERLQPSWRNFIVRIATSNETESISAGYKLRGLDAPGIR